MSRPFLVLAVLGLATIVGCGSSGGDEVGSGESDLTAQGVDVVGSPKVLPIAEVSGLGKRRVSNKTKFLAIGDGSASVVTFDVGSNGGVTNIEEHDLSNLFQSRQTQWEAVAGDGDGRVFLLSEKGNTIDVLDKNLGQIVHSIKLVIPDDHALAGDWDADDNARGEGMVLLSNGHVLVVKEKDPAALVEFAPANEAPAGFNAQLALGDTGVFPLPTGAQSELVATKHWTVKNSSAQHLKDISDLAVDDVGRLVLLSDKSRTIVRIEATLDPTENKIEAKAAFSLPSAVSKPEGLVFSGTTPLVAIDESDADADALFTIEALSP